MSISEIGSFRVIGLDPTPFVALAALDDEALAARGARRRLADEAPGFPCRISLEDAAVGERVLVLAWRHHDVATPYAASGPIFVREAALGRADAGPVVLGAPPASMRSRLYSLRGYDAEGFMRTAEVAEGPALAPTIERLLDAPDVAYLHLHHARQGCYWCRVER